MIGRELDHAHGDGHAEQARLVNELRDLVRVLFGHDVGREGFELMRFHAEHRGQRIALTRR